MSRPTRRSDQAPDTGSKSRAAILVLVVLPSISTAAIGGAVGYGINGAAGMMAGALFFGFTGFLIGMSLLSIAGPIPRRALPAISVAVLMTSLFTYLLLT